MRSCANTFKHHERYNYIAQEDAPLNFNSQKKKNLERSYV